MKSKKRPNQWPLAGIGVLTAIVTMILGYSFFPDLFQREIEDRPANVITMTPMPTAVPQSTHVPTSTPTSLPTATATATAEVNVVKIEVLPTPEVFWAEECMTEEQKGAIQKALLEYVENHNQTFLEGRLQVGAVCGHPIDADSFPIDLHLWIHIAYDDSETPIFPEIPLGKNGYLATFTENGEGTIDSIYYAYQRETDREKNAVDTGS